MTAALSVVVTGIMAYTFERFATTKNVTINGAVAFGKDPKVWPTIMMLAIGVITMCFNFAILIAYSCGYQAADRVASRSKYLTLLHTIGHLIAWIVAATTFKKASTGRDIWAFACSDAPADVQIQEKFQGIVNYDRLCTVNVSFDLSIGNLN
jgi:hypothetical protein